MRKHVDSGVPGVYWENDRQCWRTFIEREGKRVYLGRRKSLDEAIELRKNADIGILPTDEEKRSRHLDKMARVRMRCVWRELPGGHGWKHFDEFVASVGDRPTRQVLAPLDLDAPIGPHNFQWVAPKFDLGTRDGKNAYLRAHRAANVELYRDKQLRRDFGISLADYNELLAEQGGVCAICGNPETAIRKGKLLPLAVDHNHRTGAPRGLLCTACNIGIGSLAESKDRLLSAIAYLEKWDGRENMPLPDNVVKLKKEDRHGG